MEKIKRRNRKIGGILGIILAVFIFIGSVGALFSVFRNREDEYYSYSSGKTTVSSNISTTFSENSWETIAKVFKSGRAYEYWNLGDIKEIELGDGYTYEVQIVDLTPNRYEFSDGSGYSNGVLQFVKCFATEYQMNSSATNVGGYSDCILRIELNTTIYDLFPDDLKNVIPEVLIASGIGDSTQSGTSYSNNKLFLASEFEVFGSRIFSIGSLEGFRQFGYYDRNNIVSERIKTSVNELSSSWWLRSSVSGYATHFCFVNADGTALCDYANASYGVCPCFAL